MNVTDYAFNDTIKAAAAIIAKAIEKHAQAQIVAAKIAANASARVAGNRVVHRDVDGN